MLDIHVIASCPNFLRANQTHLTILSDDILDGGLPKFRKGCLTLPKGPGLGVQLDRQRVAKYARYFEEHRELPGYGTGMDLQKNSGRPLLTGPSMFQPEQL